MEIPADIRVAEDVWPFLYLRNPMIPDLALRGIAAIGLLSVFMLWLFGWKHLLMLFLGAGFMLLETKRSFTWRSYLAVHGLSTQWCSPRFW